MEVLLFLPLILSFAITFLVMPSWIRRAKNAGLEGKDINKYEKPRVAEAGGIVVLAGFTLGLLVYIAIITFNFSSTDHLIEILALLTVILILAFIGLIDSLFAASSNSAVNQHILGWRRGLSKKYRLVLCLFAAIPLMVINAGHSTLAFPIIGNINLGLIYPLFLIPIGIAGASTTFNFLAGFNGLESSQGIIIIGALSVVAYFTGNSWLALIGVVMVLALLGFWIFNKYPARVFPSDVLTYPMGGMIAIMAILGNMEKIALFFFIPYVVEVILKSRGRLVKQSFGKPNKDGSLDMPYDKIYGLEHFAIFCLKKIRGKVYETEVVYFINIIQILIIAIGFIVFRESIF